MTRNLLLVIVVAWSCAACAAWARPRAPRPVAERGGPTRARASPEPGAAGEPPLGSPALASHLYAAPPPPSLLAKVGPGPTWPARLAFPSPRRVVGRTFGSGPSRCHLALDLGAQPGDPVWAAEAGAVAYVGPFGTGGQVIMLVHPGGYVTVYAHLSSSQVHVGDAVRRGQPIARAGSSGNATGTHLHFVLLVEGHPVDPLPLLEPRPSFVAGVRRFATPEKAAQAWRHCPARGQRYEDGAAAPPPSP